MTPTRATLAIPAALLTLSGCGVATAATGRTTTVSVVPPSSPLVAPDRELRPIPAPPSRPTYVVATVAATGSDEWLEILTTTGTVVARTEIAPTSPWMVAAGAGGAYWSQDGVEHELSPSGVVSSIGQLPKNAGGVVIGPDGTSFAYASAGPLSNDRFSNTITVVRAGQSPQVVADRVSDPNHPTSDAPSSWEYYLISWTAPGIAFARVPYGGCGCGSFDMQMQSAFSSIIDPVSERVTTLTADDACPLSTVGPAVETVCFAGTDATDAIRITTAGVVTHNFTLSGANLAGDAVFSADGGSLAYITIPTSESGCGATLTPTFRVLNLTSGTARTANLGDFTPVAWVSGGPILGSITRGADAELVAVDTTTMAVTTVAAAAAGAQIVGIV